MADLFNLRETSGWIDEWRRIYGKNETAFKAFLKETAIEQRANYRSATFGGRSPGWCDPEEYLRCVELLERESGL